MPKRRIDPATGEPQLTYKEQVLVNEFMSNGGNGAQAAAAAGYKAARLDQAAYQALHRDCVQQHIRQRIQESRVTSDEIVGTLVSHMRGNPTEFFDEFGNFSIEVAKQKGIGHLIKSISGTICDPPDFEEPPEELEALADTQDPQYSEYPKDTEDPHPPDHTGPDSSPGPARQHHGAHPPTRPGDRTRKRRTSQRPRSFRFQLHSPLQAASILARLIGPDRHRPYHPLSQPSAFQKPATNPDFDPNAILQSVIEEQMKEHGLSREAVTDRLLQVRPQFAKYLDELPSPPSLLDQLSLRDTGKLLAVTLDAVASLRSSLANPATDDRVLHACQQVEAVIPLLDPRLGGSESSRHSGSGSPIAVPEPAGSCHGRSRLHATPAVFQTGSPVISAAAPGSPPDQPIGAIPQPDQLDLARSQSGQLDPQPDSTERDPQQSDPHQPDPSQSVSDNQPDPASHNLQLSTFNLQPEPHAAEPQPATCNLQPATNSQPATSSPTPHSALPTPHSPLPDPAALDAFRRTYSVIDRPFQFGLLDTHFTEVIDRIMRDQSLTPQQAVDAIWLAARQSTWSSAHLIDRCITDYASLHPRLAHAQPPVCVQRPPSPPRYWRPASTTEAPTPNFHAPQLTGDSNDSDASNQSNNSEILTSIQLFSSNVRPPPARSRRTNRRRPDQ